MFISGSIVSLSQSSYFLQFYSSYYIPYSITISLYPFGLSIKIHHKLSVILLKCFLLTVRQRTLRQIHRFEIQYLNPSLRDLTDWRIFSIHFDEVVQMLSIRLFFHLYYMLRYFYRCKCFYCDVFARADSSDCLSNERGSC